MSRRVPKPTDISYNKKDIRKAATRQTLPRGLHYFGHVEAKNQVIEKGDYEGSIICRVRCVAFKNPEDTNSKVRPAMRDSLWFPFNNPDVPGHKAPDFAARLAHEYLHACFEDEIPDMPHKDEDGNLVFQGEIVAEAGDENMSVIEQEKRDEAMELVYDKCRDILGDASILLPANFYGEVGPDKKTGQYTNILGKYCEVPEDMDLYDWSAHETEEADEVEEEEEVEEEAPAPRRSKKKKTSKKRR